MIRKLWPGMLCLAAATVFGLVNLSRLPLRVASHWGVNGEVNGWSSRTVLVLLIPVIATFVALLLSVAPRIDPKFRNFPMHAGSYWLVANVVIGFQAVLHLFMIGYNLGWPLDLNRIVGISMGIVFMVLGNVLTRVRPNWIFGVRTPWTLSSDLSWRTSHRLAGYLFVISGVAVAVTAVVSPRRMVVALLVGVGLSTVLTVIWSYIAWKRDPVAQEKAR